MIGGSKTSILIPSSTTMESADVRIRTLKVGQIARAAAVFQVDQIVIYRDKEFDDSWFINKILEYAETPQYLRKKLFPRMKELRYVGILPPLRTAHHPTRSKAPMLKVGEFRVGLVVDDVGSDDGAWVDIGIESPVPLHTKTNVKVGQRLNVRIFSLKPLAAELVDRSEIPLYWGYKTKIVPSLEEYICSTNDLVLVASKKGKVATPSLVQEIVRQSQAGLAVVFGSPARGVDAFLSNETMDRCRVINTIPHQGTETVRVEEAIIATLALLNLMRSLEG
ncbi:MAG: putative RNA uridine N3 methyltransferase [Methanotrichaceae archaeon]